MQELKIQIFIIPLTGHQPLQQLGDISIIEERIWWERGQADQHSAEKPEWTRLNRPPCQHGASWLAESQNMRNETGYQKVPENPMVTGQA